MPVGSGGTNVAAVVEALSWRALTVESVKSSLQNV